MQITNDIGKVVRKITKCPEVARVYDDSLAVSLSPVQQVDYVVGLTENLCLGQASRKLLKNYQALKELAPAYFAEDKKSEPVGKVHRDWNNCHKPKYGGN